MFKNIKEIKKYIEENDVEFIDFKLVDLQGRFRHLSIPAERLTEQTMKDGIGFDASNYGYANVEKSDMVFIPDLKTAMLDPFSKSNVITMMANVYVIDNPSNRPFNQYPRNIVKAAIDYMKKNKIADEMIIGPEYEFNIFDVVRYGLQPNNVFYNLESKESEWDSDNEWYSGETRSTTASTAVFNSSVTSTKNQSEMRISLKTVEMCASATKASNTIPSASS